VIAPIVGGDPSDHGFVQFAPVHAQMLAPQVQCSDVWQVILHTSPLHEHVLESVQVRLQPPLGF